jgi:ubiquinone/menaquinone biosynthesis C-methylase UbiE
MAFTKQSVIFDELYSDNIIVQYKRKRVREHVSRYLPAGSSILELNSGTGEDAVWFAKQGHRVHATDISAGMQEQLVNKAIKENLRENISNELVSFTQLDQLKNTGPFDLIFSNFAGLNCTHELNKVLHSFLPLLKPNGVVTLVILPKFCVWEFLQMFRGKFKLAFRRLAGNKGVRAHVEGEYFQCSYYNPSYVIRHTKKELEFLALEGLCTIVPPSYMENFAKNYPKTSYRLMRWEDKWKGNWPWKGIGDYYIISLKRTSEGLTKI